MPLRLFIVAKFLTFGSILTILKEKASHHFWGMTELTIKNTTDWHILYYSYRIWLQWYKNTTVPTRKGRIAILPAPTLFNMNISWSTTVISNDSFYFIWWSMPILIMIGNKQGSHTSPFTSNHTDNPLQCLHPQAFVPLQISLNSPIIFPHPL